MDLFDWFWYFLVLLFFYEGFELYFPHLESFLLRVLPLSFLLVLELLLGISAAPGLIENIADEKGILILLFASRSIPVVASMNLSLESGYFGISDLCGGLGT